MKCQNCSHEQSSGKFCGKCGGALIAQSSNIEEPLLHQTSAQKEPLLAQSTAAAASPQAPIEPSIHVEKVKNTSKQYWSYFLEHLKNPSSILKNPEKNLVNAIITLAIFALLTALGIYDFMSYFMAPINEFGSFLEQESLMPSFFQILFYTIISLAVVFALSIVSIFLVTKFFGPPTQFKPLITMLGTYLVPVTVVMLAAYFLLLMESRTFGSSLFILGISFSVYVLPLFLVITLVNQRPHMIDSFYAFIGYIILFTVLLSIVLSIFVDSTLNELFSELYDMFAYSNFY